MYVSIILFILMSFSGPVGFKSTRYYTSMVNIDRRCLYTCEIRDGGNAPQFVLTCEDCKDKPIVSYKSLNVNKYCLDSI